MDKYLEIKNLIAATSRVERDGILNIFNSQVKSELNIRGIQLVRFLIQNPKISESELLDKLQIDNIATSTIRSLYGYVRSLILESFLLDINIERPNDNSSSFRNKILALKRMLQSQILIGKGLYEEASTLIDESISKSSKYNHYSITQEALELKMLLSVKDKSSRTVRNKLSLLKLIGSQRTTIERIQHEFMNASIESNKPEDTQAKNIETAIQKSMQLNADFPSPLGEYYILLLREKLATLNKSHEHSEKLLLESLSFLEAQHSIYSLSREVDLTLKLSVTYAYLKKFEDATKVLNTIKAKIKKNHIEAYITSKRLVILSLYSQDYDAVIKQIKTLQNSKHTLRQPYASSRYQFLKATHALCTDDIKTCCKIVLEELKLKYKNSNDLLFGNLITLSLASYQLPATEKSFKSSVVSAARSSLNRLNTELFNEREFIIYDVIRTIIERSNAEFKFKNYFKKQFSALQEYPQKEQWKPYGFELFSFGNWLKSQITDSKCDFKLV